MPDNPPIGEAQTALLAVRQMRSLLSCDGWAGMHGHLVGERDKLAAQILDDDALSHEERERMRAQYKVFRDLVDWPRKTLEAQVSVLERTRTGPDNVDSDAL